MIKNLRLNIIFIILKFFHILKFSGYENDNNISITWVVILIVIGCVIRTIIIDYLFLRVIPC